MNDEQVKKPTETEISLKTHHMFGSSFSGLDDINDE